MNTHSLIRFCTTLAAVVYTWVAQAQPVGQIVTISSQFQDILQPAAIWVETRDPNAGSTRPFFLRLESNSQTQVFATYASDFILHRIWLEYDDQTIVKPCTLTRDIISNRSVEIHLTGVLGSMFAGPHCQIRYHQTPPIQQSLLQQQTESKQELETEQPIVKEESRYYAGLKDCTPGAFRYSAYQPFIDERSETLVVIEGIKDDRCSVLTENHFQSVQGKDTTAITRCRFSTGTRDNMSPKNIGILLQASQSNEIAKTTFYTKAMCDECSATASGKNLKCFEKYSDGTTATGAAGSNAPGAPVTVSALTSANTIAPAKPK